MKTKIEDLREHLFAQLERLNDEELGADKLDREIQRAKAVSEVANAVIGTAKVEVEFLKATGHESGSDFFPQDRKPGLPPSPVRSLSRK